MCNVSRAHESVGFLYKTRMFAEDQKTHRCTFIMICTCYTANVSLFHCEIPSEFRVGSDISELIFFVSWFRYYVTRSY